GRTPDVPLDAFRGRVVFVGVSATGATDLDTRTTPLSAAEPGVLIHLTALDNLLAGDAPRPVGPVTNALLVATAGLGVGVLTSALGSVLAATLLAAAVLVALAAGTTLLLGAGVQAHVAAP